MERILVGRFTCGLEKQGAEPNYKGFGLHPPGCWCDNTGEPLAARLRPGSAGWR
jgi:hypothetical protein